VCKVATNLIDFTYCFVWVWNPNKD